MTDGVRRVFEPSRETEVYGEYEVVVLGGGPSGLAAAIAAGRAGLSTILIERYGFLGGSGTAAAVTNFCGLHANVEGDIRQVVTGIACDIQERLESVGGIAEPHSSLGGRTKAQAYDSSAYKIVTDQMVQEAGVKLLFHTFAVGVTMDSESEIVSLLVETKSGRRAVIGKVFIDCSGDADLAAWAGAPFEKGSTEFDLMYATTKFRIIGVDAQKAGPAWDIIPEMMEKAEREEGLRFPRKGAIVRPQPNPSEWRANVTQVRNPDGSPIDGTDLDQLTYGEIEGRRQCWDVFDFIRRRVPGFENSYIVEIAPQLGIRESRRIVGEYMLSEDDVLGCADFDDTIGVNGWPIERHIPGDILIRFPPIPDSRGFCHLPYRMLLPQRVDNLLVAGRCASMTHEGQSAARVSGACFVMGQAAATAAGLAIQADKAPRQISVVKLQEQLEADGAYLGRKW